MSEVLENSAQNEFKINSRYDFGEPTIFGVIFSGRQELRIDTLEQEVENPRKIPIP